METKNESPSNQTQNGSNENNQTSAGNTTETMFNETNSTMEKNLNGEEAQQQSEMTAPVAGGTKFEAGEEVPSGLDLGEKKSQEYNESEEADDEYVDFDDDSEASNDGTQTKVDKPKSFKLKRKQIYALSILLGQNFQIGLLGINRKVNKNALAKKIQSIKDSDGLISPVLVVTAEECLKLGLEVYVGGVLVTSATPDLDKILVVIDGQHRLKAVNEINKKRAKDGEKLCEAFVYLPLNEGVDIRTLLRETNVATHPWKGGDWLVNILMNADGKIDMSMLNWVHSISPDCGDTSAWLWGTLNPSRVYTKAKLIEAAKNKEVLEVIANTLYFQEGKELYENAKKKFSVSLTKLKVFPKWFIDKKDDLIQKDLKMSEIMKKFKEFIDMINSDEVENIKGLKKDDNSSKDAKIKKALDRLWAEKIK
jgi:hypothetical protein